MGGRDTIRVAIADDHELFRRGMEALIDCEDDLELVAEAGSASDAVAAVLAHRPDVALLDLHLGGQSGIDACTAIKMSSPQTKVLFLTASEEPADLFKALMVGACGYLLKSLPAAQIIDAVRLAHAGEVMVPPPMARHLVAEFARLSSQTTDVAVAHRARTLTDREIEVLTWITRGRSNREIGECMSVSENTIKNHVRNIMGKLQVTSRTEAAMHAVRENLIASA